MQSNQKKILIVVDMQNDFITGALGSEEARAIVPKVDVYKRQGLDRAADPPRRAEPQKCEKRRNGRDR